MENGRKGKEQTGNEIQIEFGVLSSVFVLMLSFFARFSHFRFLWLKPLSQSNI